MTTENTMGHPDFIEPGADDLAGSKLLTPAWYLVQLTEYAPKISKDTQSMNWNFRGKVLKNMETGEAVDARLPRLSFNSKAKWATVAFFRAMGVEPKPGEKYMWSAFVGRELQVFIENGEYNGQPQNQINGKFRPADYGVKA